MNRTQQWFGFRHKPMFNSFDWNLLQPSLACLPWTPVPWTVHVLSFSETWHKTSKHVNDHNSRLSLYAIHFLLFWAKLILRWWATHHPEECVTIPHDQITFHNGRNRREFGGTLCFPCSCQKGAKWISFACILILLVLLTGSDSEEEWNRQDDADKHEFVQ